MSDADVVPPPHGAASPRADLRRIGGEMFAWTEREPKPRGAVLLHVLGQLAGGGRGVLIAGPHADELVAALVDGGAAVSWLLRSLRDAEAAARAHPAVTVLAGSAARLDRADLFDVVVAVDGVDRLNSTEGDQLTAGELIDRLAAVVRPGGVLVLMHDNHLGLHHTVRLEPGARERDDSAWYPLDEHDTQRPASRAQLTDQLVAAGLTVECGYAVFPEPSAPTVLVGPGLVGNLAAPLRPRLGSVLSQALAAAYRGRPVLSDPRRLLTRALRAGAEDTVAPAWLIIARADVPEKDEESEMCEGGPGQVGESPGRGGGGAQPGELGVVRGREAGGAQWPEVGGVPGRDAGQWRAVGGMPGRELGGLGALLGQDLLIGDVCGSFAYEMNVGGITVLHPLEGASERDGLRRVGEPVAPGVGDGYVLEERLLHLAATADLPGLRDELTRYDAWLRAHATDDKLGGPVALAGLADVFVAEGGPVLLPTRWEPVEPVPLSVVRVRAFWEFAVELIASGRPHPWPITSSAAELAGTLLGMVGHALGDALLGEAVDLQVRLEGADRGPADEQRRELLTASPGSVSVDVAGYRELTEALWRQRYEVAHLRALMEWTEQIIRSRDYTLSKLDLEIQFYRSRLAGKALVLGRRAYQIVRRDAGRLLRRARSGPR